MKLCTLEIELDVDMNASKWFAFVKLEISQWLQVQFFYKTIYFFFCDNKAKQDSPRFDENMGI